MANQLGEELLGTSDIYASKAIAGLLIEVGRAREALESGDYNNLCASSFRILDSAAQLQRAAYLGMKVGRAMRAEDRAAGGPVTHL